MDPEKNEVVQDGNETPTEGATPENLKNQDHDDYYIEGVEMDDGTEEPVEERKEDADTTTPAAGDAGTEEVGGKETQTETVDQDKVQARINKITRQKHEEARRREEAEKRAAEAEAKLKELQGDTEEIVVPPMPDPYDDDYEQKVAARDEAIRKWGEREAIRKEAQKKAEDDRMAAAKAIADEFNGLSNSMYESAERFGIKMEELQKADVAAAPFIKDQNLARFILSHEKSPLLVNYLGNNAAILDSIGSMDPVSATSFIITDVLPKLNAMMPRTTTTPSPPNVPKGRAAGESKSPYLDGVTFE